MVRPERPRRSGLTDRAAYSGQRQCGFQKIYASWRTLSGFGTERKTYCEGHDHGQKDTCSDGEGDRGKHRCVGKDARWRPRSGVKVV